MSDEYFNPEIITKIEENTDKLILDILAEQKESIAEIEKETKLKIAQKQEEIIDEAKKKADLEDDIPVPSVETDDEIGEYRSKAARSLQKQVAPQYDALGKQLITALEVIDHMNTHIPDDDDRYEHFQELQKDYKQDLEAIKIRINKLSNMLVHNIKQINDEKLKKYAVKITKMLKQK